MGLKITLRSLNKAYKSKRKHLNVTLLKSKKKSQNHHHKQNNNKSE